VICRPWSPNYPDIILPSWIRTLDHASLGSITNSDAGNHRDRRHADVLVGTSLQSPYSASRRATGEWEFRKEERGFILSARGFQLDVIDEVEFQATAGVIPRDWLKHARIEITGSGVTESFWRTMVAGKGPDGQNPPPYYAAVCELTFKSQDDVNLPRMRDRNNNSLHVDYIRRVESVVWGRSLTRITWQGRLALVPSKAWKGDIVCILLGCSVPVVLRRLPEKFSTVTRLLHPWESQNGDSEIQTKEFPLYELIGECYVHRMMAGEAFEVKNASRAEAAKFYEYQTFQTC
jgi:hypothetical protein